MNLLTQTFFLLGASQSATPLLPDADPGSLLLRIGLIGLLLVLNAFFVACEFAIVKVRSSQLEPLVEEGNHRAIIAEKLAAHPLTCLSACQLGITVCSLAIGFLGAIFVTPLVEPLFHLIGLHNAHLTYPFAILIAFLGLTILHVILGELVPKSLAIQRPLETALWTALPLRFFHILFKPIVWFLNRSADLFLVRVLRIQPNTHTEAAHSEEDLRLILSNQEGSEVSELSKELLINALDLRRRVVRDIMTPRGDVVYLDTDDTLEENLTVARESMHTRFPLCQGHLDNTIGLVHIKDLFSLSQADKTDLLGIKRDLLPVPEMMPLEKLLTFFLSKQMHLAIVVDEYGGTVGVVTLDDVLAELVGEIQDEFDTKEERAKVLNDDEFIVEGPFGLYELKDLADLELESADVSTIGGYVTHQLGHLPKPGEVVRIEDYLVTVTKADERRVVELHFKKEPLPDATEESAANASPNGNGRQTTK